MTMEGGGHAVSVERLFETARPQEGEDLARLAFHRRFDRRIVEHGDALRRVQARERGLELQRLRHRLVDERLGRFLAPWLEGAPSEAAAEPLHPREPDAEHLHGLA